MGASQEPILARSATGATAGTAGAYRQLPQWNGSDPRGQPVTQDQAAPLRLHRSREQFPGAGGRRRRWTGGAGAGQRQRQERTRPPDSPVNPLCRAGHA